MESLRDVRLLCRVLASLPQAETGLFWENGDLVLESANLFWKVGIFLHRGDSFGKVRSVFVWFSLRVELLHVALMAPVKVHLLL